MAKERIKKYILPKFLLRFMATESASGGVMLVFTLIALIAANSGVANIYQDFVHLPISFSVAGSSVSEPLREWIKDILMVLFFFLIGMELKREIKVGFLSKKGQILLPMSAAIGGMLVPALIFYATNSHNSENLAGWAIPTATDIAFALAILSIFGKNIPASVKIFLLAIAIFDDFGAIIIIAAFYNTHLAIMPIALAIIGVLALFILNKRNITSLTPYFITLIYLWFCLYNAGIHTTIAGVLVGFAIPMGKTNNTHRCPLETAIEFLHPWVNFLILPLFAFTSAGVGFSGIHELISNHLPISIALGLFLGKQLGVFGVSFAMIKLRFAPMPESANWLQIYAVAILAGIGFTMSFFIGMIAFSNPEKQELIKIGVLTGSFASALFGAIVLKLSK